MTVVAGVYMAGLLNTLLQRFRSLLAIHLSDTAG
jgi:hypothetical protein